MLYSELTANIEEIVENEFTSSQLAMFVQQAEQKIYNSVQIANLRKNVTGQLTADNQYLSAPSDFLSVYSMAVITGVTGGNTNTGTYAYLLNKDVNFIREAYPPPNSKGVPRHYAIFGPRSDDDLELSFIVGPTPDSAYYIELHYYYYPESIVTAGQTWLGDNFDSALLNGAVLEAARFMKAEADQVSFYSQMYAQAMALLKNLGDGKQRMDAYRDGQVRNPVK